MSRVYKGYWYAVSPSRVVFVVGGNPGVIVTVWRLDANGGAA
jgi:hypothetical protein